MSRFHSYIRSASTAINSYHTGKPFAIHLRSFFAADKKFGSKDRKIISSLCYYYFRTGKAFTESGIEEKILAGLFLCENSSNELLQFFKPSLNEKIALPLSEKISLLQLSEESIFPFADELGKDIDQLSFIHSFLRQPGTYLRIRPGKRKLVIEKLSAAAVDFESVNDECLKVFPGAAVDKILVFNKEAVVQDMNSQRVLNYLENDSAFDKAGKKIASWDCCAASGGKSILLFDKLKGNIQLTVSDIRENILVNLRKRMQEAAINLNRSFVTDLTRGSGLPADEKFSIILCDVPCTGSGTWSRTPEQLFSFEQQMIHEYVQQQQQIVSHAIPHLADGGLFFYITCSVFSKENEENVDLIQKKFHLQLVQVEYLKGYALSADTMFVAVFRKG